MVEDLRSWFGARMITGDVLELPLLGAIPEVFRLRLLHTVIPRCPAHFVIALPANDAAAPRFLTAWQAAAGRAMDSEDAQFGAVAEAVERACLMTSGTADPRASSAKAEAPTIDAATYWQYNADQLHHYRSESHYTANYNCGWYVDNLWMKGSDLLTGGGITLPGTAIFADEDIRIGLPPVLCSSSGTAVRDTFAAAVQHAVLERIERDLVAIWWYNRLPAARLAPDDAAAVLPAELASWLASRGRKTHHLVMPSDLPATAVVALSARTDGSRPAIGASASLDPATAVLSATLEMLQGEISLSLMRRAQAEADAPPIPPLLAWSEAANSRGIHLAGAGLTTLPPPTTFNALKSAFRDKGIRVHLADLTRPEFGIPVARAVSPDLRDWQPRFAPGRLFDVPVALGLLARPNEPAALNPVPFPI